MEYTAVEPVVALRVPRDGGGGRPSVVRRCGLAVHGGLARGPTGSTAAAPGRRPRTAEFGSSDSGSTTGSVRAFTAGWWIGSPPSPSARRRRVDRNRHRPPPRRDDRLPAIERLDVLQRRLRVDPRHRGRRSRCDCGRRCCRPAGRSSGRQELVVGRLGEAVMGPRREPSATDGVGNDQPSLST